MSKYQLIHGETQQVLGYLEIGRQGKAVFTLADGISPDAWNSVGFLPVDPKTKTLEDQGFIYYSLQTRVPLKERLTTPSKKKTAKYLSVKPLSVVTDSLSFVAC